MATRVTLSDCRAAFVYLDKPRENKFEPDKPPKYQLTLLFEEGSNQHAELQKAIEAEMENVEVLGKPLRKLRYELIKDGDDKDYEGFPGRLYVEPKSNDPVAVVGPDIAPIPPKNVYPGSYVNASLNVAAYDYSGSKGVTLYLNGVQFVRDGDRFGGGAPSVDSMFKQLS